MKGRYILYASCAWLALLTTACRFGRKEPCGPKPVQYTFSERSKEFTDERFSLRIDTACNFLDITLSIDERRMKDFPFPKFKNVELLPSTAFRFILSCDGRPVEGAGLPTFYKGHRYFGYSPWLSNRISFITDTADLRMRQAFFFRIPFYAFSRLKAGTHQFALSCMQDVFCSPTKYQKVFIDQASRDSVWKDVRDYMPAPLISFSAKFSLTVPPIFKTVLYMQKIELRNDSVFSPSGMDNTLWNSSYPDIYWTVHFPNDEQYCCSDFIKSTDTYDTRDTFYLYHYSPADSVAFGIWDHDNLSRDDHISYGRFSLTKFPQDKPSAFPFQNIREFSIRVKREGVVNR